NRMIDAHLQGGVKWSLPSTIYGEAPVLYQGSTLRPSSLIHYLQKLNYHRSEGPAVKTGEYAAIKTGIVFEKHASFSDQSNLFPVLVEFNGFGVGKIVNMK